MNAQRVALRRRGFGAAMACALAEWAGAWRLADADAPNGLTRKALMLDVCERLFVSAMFLNFIYRLGSDLSISFNLITALLAVAETLPFLLIVARTPSITLSQRPTDWCFGILGTVFPLLVKPVAGVLPLIPMMVCLGIMVAGITMQIMAKLVLGRAFGVVAANRGVRIAGPYRFVRHPIYAGYTLTHVGFLLAMPSLMNALFYAMALTMQVARIFREEHVLGQDADYRAFAARVRYRLLPGIF